jgi:DNA (cytosine-5)-methyltransferase 1
MSKNVEKCQYVCSKCGYTTTHKGHYTHHLNKKNPCVNNHINDQLNKIPILESKVNDLEKSNKDLNERVKELEKQTNIKEKVKAISLFSGMGGDSVGIVKAGLKLVGYSEWEKEMRDTHELNFPETSLLGCGDILKTLDEEFLKYKYIVDLIFAGFPCQGFSNAGNKDPNDPRNSLFREFARSAKLIKPKYVIGENVKGLLQRKTANGEEYMDIIKSEFNKIGYDIYYKVYMCSKLDIGVPQNRERLIIVGIRQDLNQDFVFPEQNENKSGNLKYIIKFTMEGTIKLKPEYLDFDFNDIPEECIITDMDNDEEESNPHPNLVQYAVKRDYERKGVKRPHRLHFGRRLDVGGEIIDIRKPINTIICSYAHCPRFFIPLKNKNGNYLRCLTPDELKQCQGFPADYKISGNTGKKIKQIGNAVPPPLIEMIVKELVK